MKKNDSSASSRERVNDSEINVNQRQATNIVTKTILTLVIAMLFTFVTLFVLFNFVCPTTPMGSESYALSSSTTYYKSGSSFYTRSSATYYKCTNSSHSGTNKYSSSSDLSGTCYTRSGTCSTCNGSGSRTKSTYHSCSKTETVTCSTCGGSKSVSVSCSNSKCSGGYVSSTCGTCSGSGTVTCGACKGAGYTTYTGSGEWWDEDHGCSSCGGSGATSVWGGGNLVKGTGKVNCSSCSGSGTKRSTCGTCGGSGSLSQSCSTCSATGSVSQTCSTCSGKGYYYTYSTVSCPTTQTNYYDHSVSSYVEYTYTDIDTGGTTTTTSSYSTATGYTVSFDANGGNGSMSSQYFLHSHSQALKANTFTRENYDFEGWATSSGGAVTYSNQQPLSLSSGSNFTLYANWDLRGAIVTLDNQGATTAGTTSVVAPLGAAMPNITIPVKNGYTFGGYFTGTNGSGTQYYTANGTSAKTSDLTAATTLYAKWTANTYDITVNLGGGSGTSGANYTVSSSSQTRTIATPTRTGYTFSQWSVSCDGGSPTISGTTLTIPANCYGAIALTAVWTGNQYTVTLDNQAATTAGSTSITVTYGSAMPSITLPVRTGYTFGGYYASANGSGAQYYAASGASARAYDLTTATTLYAKWIANTYTITYNANGGTASASTQEVTFDSAYGTLATATLTGYHLDTWYTRYDLNAVPVNTGTHMRVDLYNNAAWTKNSADVGRYLHTKITFTGNSGPLEFNDVPLSSNDYTITTDDNGVTTVIFDFLTTQEQISLRGPYNYGTDYRFLDFEQSTDLANVTVVECYLGDAITADTVVKIAGDHTVYARWLPNAYNIAFDESGYAGLMDAAMGGFEASGWSGGAGSGYDTTRVRTGAYSFKIAANSSSYEFYAYTNIVIPITDKNHIFYAQFWGYQEEVLENSFCQIYWPEEEPAFGQTETQPFGPAGQWNRYSFYGSRSANALTGIQRIRIDFDNQYGVGNLWIDDFMIYDLTALFGAGNEPSLEWCNMMIKTGVGVQRLTVDRTQNLSAHSASMTGNTFSGWSTTPRTTIDTPNEAEYADGAVVRNLSVTQGAFVTLYAVWTPNQYTVTVEPNIDAAVGTLSRGGEYSFGKKLTLSAGPKGNHVFVRWLKNGAVFAGNTSQTLTVYVSGSDTYTAEFKRASLKTDDVMLQVICQDESVTSAFGYAKFTTAVRDNVAYAHFEAGAADGYSFVGWQISGIMSTTYTARNVSIPLAEVQGKIVCAVFAKD